MRKWVLSAICALGLIALALPVHWAADWIVGPVHHATAQVIRGVWILKGLLLMHCGVALWIMRHGGGPSPVRPDEGALSAHSRIAVWEIASLAGLLLVGAAVRMHDLGDGLWFDEIQTLVDYVRLPIGTLVTTYDSQNQHMFYSLLARGSFALFGESARALRLPSAALGIASLAALWWFGRLVLGAREALLATGLLTFSYHHVWFSQNARGYTGLLLWTLMSSALFLCLLDRRYRAPWGYVVGYALASAFAAYTHITALFVVAAHGSVWLLWVWRARRGNRNAPSIWYPAAALALAITLTLLLYSLVLPQIPGPILHPASTGTVTTWKNPAWFVAESLRGLNQGVPGGLVAAFGGALIGLAGVWSIWRRSPVAVGVMVFPVLVSALGLIVLHHNLWPRFFFFASGFAILIVIRGGFALAHLLPGHLGVALATVGWVGIIAASASTIPRAYAPKQDFESAAMFVDGAHRPEDAVVTVDLTRYPYSQYYRRPWSEVTDVAGLEAIEHSHARTWILYTFPTRLAEVAPDLWAHVQQRYRQAANFRGTVGGGDITVMSTQ